MEKLKRFPKRIIAILCIFAILLYSTTATGMAADVESDNFVANTTEITVNYDPLIDTIDVTESDIFVPDATEVNNVFTTFSEEGNNSIIIDVVEINGVEVIKIANSTDHAISMKGMYLTDDSGNLFKWQSPSIIIREDQDIVIKGNNDYNTKTLKRAMTNFNVDEASNLYLTDATGEIAATWSRNPTSFTRADMEELLAYGMSVGGDEESFYAAISPPSSINETLIRFATFPDTRQFRLKLVHDSPGEILIGYAPNPYMTLIFTDSVYSIAEAKTAIFNFFNP